MEINIDGEVYAVTEETQDRVYYKDALEQVKFVERTDPNWSYSTRRVLYIWSEEGFKTENGNCLPYGINLFEIPPGMTDQQAVDTFNRYADGLGKCTCGLPANIHMGHPKIIEVEPITRIAK